MLQILNLATRSGAAVESIDSWLEPCFTSSLLGDKELLAPLQRWEKETEGLASLRLVSGSWKGKLMSSVPVCPWAPGTSGWLLCWLSIGCGLGIGRALGGLSLRVPHRLAPHSQTHVLTLPDGQRRCYRATPHSGVLPEKLAPGHPLPRWASFWGDAFSDATSSPSIRHLPYN